ncbi:MAG: hypothetical protein ACJ74Z_23550 [Bryobacteraceae bacterium]
MPKYPKVVSITVGRPKRPEQLPRVIRLPSSPGRIPHTLECWQTATSIDLVLGTAQFAPDLGWKKRSITKPALPIPIRPRTTPDE